LFEKIVNAQTLGIALFALRTPSILRVLGALVHRLGTIFTHASVEFNREGSRDAPPPAEMTANVKWGCTLQFLLDLLIEVGRHIVVHLEYGVLHFVLRCFAVHRVDDIEPQIVGKPDLVAA
jgi:hypothetical protein